MTGIKLLVAAMAPEVKPSRISALVMVVLIASAGERG